MYSKFSTRLFSGLLGWFCTLIDKKWTYINVFWSLATITHCSESLPFVQKFNLDKMLHNFDFYAKI